MTTTTPEDDGGAMNENPTLVEPVGTGPEPGSDSPATENQQFLAFLPALAVGTPSMLP